MHNGGYFCSASCTYTKAVVTRCEVVRLRLISGQVVGVGACTYMIAVRIIYANIDIHHICIKERHSS